MRRTIVHRTRRAYFLVLLVPFLLSIFVLWFAEYYRSSIRWVTHTEQVLAEVDQLFLLITEAESSQRGFALTGEERFSTEFKAAKARVTTLLAAVRALIHDNPTQRRRIEELAPAVAKRIEGLEQLISLRRKTGTPVIPAATPLRREGSLLMTTIRAIVLGLKREEQRLLDARLRGEWEPQQQGQVAVSR